MKTLLSSRRMRQKIASLAVGLSIVPALAAHADFAGDHSHVRIPSCTQNQDNQLAALVYSPAEIRAISRLPPSQEYGILVRRSGRFCCEIPARRGRLIPTGSDAFCRHTTLRARQRAAQTNEDDGQLRCSETWSREVARFQNPPPDGSVPLTRDVCDKVTQWRRGYYRNCQPPNERQVIPGASSASNAVYNARFLACRCQYNLDAGNPPHQNPSPENARNFNAGPYGGRLPHNETCRSYLQPRLPAPAPMHATPPGAPAGEEATSDVGG